MDVGKVVLAQVQRGAHDVAAVVGNSPAARARDLGDQAVGMRRLKHRPTLALAFFGSCSAEALLRYGTASGHIMSARAFLFAIAGHEAHHLESLRTVYLAR